MKTPTSKSSDRSQEEFDCKEKILQQRKTFQDKEKHQWG
jgi:hypothetical protein